MGDSSFWHRVRTLAAGALPLVRIEAGDAPGSHPPPGSIEITDAGRAVLSGSADAVALNGFDRWLGGVHLQAPPGGDVAWRYGDGRIVSR